VRKSSSSVTAQKLEIKLPLEKQSHTKKKKEKHFSALRPLTIDVILFHFWVC
jgi:hypothetical protein